MKKGKYKYKINEIVNVSNTKVKILEQIRMNNGKNRTQKGYKYVCLTCNNVNTITETHLNIKRGCSVCSGKKVLVGYNDMWTTNPKLASLLVDPKDGYKYTQGSGKYVDFKCLDCGNIIKHKRIEDINKYGLSCPKCSDGISIPEKTMFNILQQLLKDNFTYQYSPKWCKYKLNNKNKTGRYDFYFKLNNKEYIIEMDGGLGHGNKVYKKSKLTKEESKQIDDIKDKLAYKHDIKVIRIDCNYNKTNQDSLEYIKSNIFNSKLVHLFNLNNIYWDKVKIFTLNNLCKKACKIKKDNFNISTTKIGKILKLHSATIIKYLKQGTKLGWCSYDPEESCIKKVICLNNNKIFASITEAKKYYNISYSISASCIGKQLYSGKSKTGEYLQWQYYDKYLVKPKVLLSNDEIESLYQKPKIKVICLNNKKVYNSILLASKETNITRQAIYKSCNNNKLKLSNKNKKLQWQYYKEYLKNSKELLSNIENK